MSTAASDFRAAIERGDLDGMVATLADDVVLHSPVSFKPFEGRAAVAQLFEIGRLDNPTVRHHNRAFDSVLQLANVAGPVECADRGDGGSTKHLSLIPELTGEAVKEIVSEQSCITRPITQWGYSDGYAIQTIV